MNRVLPPIVFIVIMAIILFAGLSFTFSLNRLFNPPGQGGLKVAGGPVTQEPVSLTLNLSSPEDNILVFSEDLLISGKTSPKAVVIISLEDQDVVVQPSLTGNFSSTIQLVNGANYFTLSAFDDAGNSKSESRTIYYSKEKI